MEPNETNKEDQPQEEVLDFTRPNYRFTPNEAHDWRQRGPFLVCKSCDIEHATYIGPGRLLTGLDEKGRPILKRVGF
jgi:hypothetical protein